MFDSRKPQWVRRTCSSLGLSIDDDAVVLLLDLVENDTAILRMNIMMLGQFLAQSGKTHITEADIESYIQHTRSESAFSLFESMATGHLPAFTADSQCPDGRGEWRRHSNHIDPPVDLSAPDLHC